MINLKNLKDKSILILGLGTEGISTLKFLRHKFPQKIFGLADQNALDQLDKGQQKIIEEDKNLKLHLGRNYQKAIDRYDIVFKSPGVQLKKSTQAKVTSQTELFFRSARDKIIGVTGTKGKTTTASLIYKILKDAKIKVLLLGNIGNPPFDVYKEIPKVQFIVYELSSFQLQDLEVSPRIAVFLNLYQEHLDYHGGFKNYQEAKSNIVKWQNESDFVIYNADSKQVAEIVKKYKAIQIPFSLKDLKKAIDTKLKGQFNQYNILAATAVAKLLKIPAKSVIQSIRTFEPVKHRLQYIGNFRGIDFYNDSMATIPQATIAALETLKPHVNTLIAGGYNRGVDYSQLSKKIKDEQIPNLILFPQTGKIILEGIKNLGYKPKHFFTTTMKEAVKIAAQVTKKGKICLMSPASSSFNLFKNYQDRGDQFTSEVKRLGA